MSNKRKLTTILAVAGATVLAAGGSAFVTQTGLSLIDRSNTTEQGSDVAVNEKERPVSIPGLLIRTEAEKGRHEAAVLRRKMRKERRDAGF